MKPNELSLEHFKRWMESQPHFQSIDKPSDKLLGTIVESKVSMKKFASKLTMESGDVNKVLEEFQSNGGKISNIEGKNFLIETENGSFIIHKYYVRKKRINEEKA
jgi:hypothetical protein